MKIKLEVSLSKETTMIQYKNTQGESTISIIEGNSKTFITQKEITYFLLKDDKIIKIGYAKQDTDFKAFDFDKIITMTSPWDIEQEYIAQLFINEAIEMGNPLTAETNIKVPANHQKSLKAYIEETLFILGKFGYHLDKKTTVPAKGKPAKTRHRWSKEVSQIEFFVDTRESKATVLWQKRNEMLLKAGATMMHTPPLNKDGSVGFSAKMGTKLRDDYSDKIKNFVTTEDLILKSVNEVGLLLYFAGTNSWLELIDANGKTIDEWTRVD